MTSPLPRANNNLQFFTVTEIAERWKASPKKVRREINSGALVVHRFGRQIRVSEADLLVYERQRRQS